MREGYEYVARRSKMALAHAPDATVEDPTAVFKAALRGDLDVLRQLLDRRDAATQEGYTPLSLAVSAQHVEASRLLLSNGVRVDAADFQGVTALMHAAMHGNTVLIRMMLLAGADPTLCRLDGKHAIGLAAEYGRPAALGAFFRHDRKLVEARDAFGRTAVLSAVISRHTPTLKYVLGRVMPPGSNSPHGRRGFTAPRV